MRNIRLLQLGQTNNTVLGNLALILSRVQTAYGITFEDDILDVTSLTPLSNGQYPIRLLEDAAIKYMGKHEYTEYPIAVTDLPLEDEIVSSADSSIALLSTHGWSTFSTFPIVKGIEFLVAGALLDMHEISVVHYDTKGCPNDYCENRTDIDIGIKKAELCHSCRTSVLSALDKGSLTLQEAIAIYRILDDIADRKICFVLMPFRPQFSKPYDAIRQAVESANFSARRADEIFETRSIVQIIYEQIGRAELVVADLTDRNPNVFYELGYAHAMGKSTILITQKESDVPFDLRHRQYLLYDPSELSSSLEVKIRNYFP